jgi:hypothetical protein
MKPIIIITCILANGTFTSPRGEYDNFKLCNWYSEQFEAHLYPKEEDRKALCWCHRRPAAPLPERAVDYDRKAPR